MPGHTTYRYHELGGGRGSRRKEETDWRVKCQGSVSQKRSMTRSFRDDRLNFLVAELSSEKRQVALGPGLQDTPLRKLRLQRQQT